ncbi:MAG: GxxExxY protein [Chloroflexota bacterium]
MIIGAAMEVHTVLGAGFLEAVYQKALEKELTLRGIPFEPKVKLPVAYKGELLGEYEADLVVDGKTIVEIKSIFRLNSVHDAQAIHYLTATGLQLALLLNFGAGSLEYRRVVKTEKTGQKIRANLRNPRPRNDLEQNES